MNLKLNTEVQGSVKLLYKRPKTTSAVKEERQRTGRYIAVLVGICLFLLAIYHAWVRRIPVVASLVVPALIMFVYVAWVLYTASRDKHKLLDAEAARAMMLADPVDYDGSISEPSLGAEVPVIAPTDNYRMKCSEPSYDVIKETKELRPLVRPIILINDKPPEDLELRISNILEMMLSDKFRDYPTRRKFKRRFCRSRKHAAFKRSYSIA